MGKTFSQDLPRPGSSQPCWPLQKKVLTTKLARVSLLLWCLEADLDFYFHSNELS